MSKLEKATAHFREKLSGELKSIKVPEWDLEIWFKTVTNLKEQSKLVELAAQNKTVEALVESLILKARNADGTKMFTNADKVTFMNEVDPNIVIKVVGEINDAIDQNDGEIEKN